MSLHRRCLNYRLTPLLPLGQPSLEIGNGLVRRGLDLYPSFTLDIDPRRAPDYVADAHKLPFPNGRFAAVACCETLQYVDHPLTVLRECRRVLRPHGRLVVSVPSKRRGDAPTDRWRWTHATLREALASAGFRVRSIIPVLGVRWYASGFVAEAVVA